MQISVCLTAPGQKEVPSGLKESPLIMQVCPWPGSLDLLGTSPRTSWYTRPVRAVPSLRPPVLLPDQGRLCTLCPASPMSAARLLPGNRGHGRGSSCHRLETASAPVLLSVPCSLVTLTSVAVYYFVSEAFRKNPEEG